MKDIDNIQMYEFGESISKLKKSHQIREKAFVNNICSNTTQYFTYHIVTYFLKFFVTFYFALLSIYIIIL